MIGHRQMLDPWQVKSSTGLNRDAWPLRVNASADGRVSLRVVCHSDGTRTAHINGTPHPVREKKSEIEFIVEKDGSLQRLLLDTERNAWFLEGQR